MRPLVWFCKSRWPGACLLALGPAVAHAQGPVKTRTLYYDSARTQRRAVFGVQLRGPRPDTVAHGPFRRYARAGHLEELGHFAQGLADSTWTRYYAPAPGQAPAVARRLPMRAGQPDGPFVVFHPNGRVAQRGTFRQGRLVDSLVTARRTGRPRLLARFDSSGAPGLRGTFRQWGVRYTADFQAAIYYWGAAISGNAYPRRDSARYWQGQLAAGRPVGAYTEYDPDGEPRVRLSYTAQGQYRLTTLYYPAAWLRMEQGADRPLPADSVVHSRPMLEWQALGRPPYLLQRYWSIIFGSVATESEDKLFQIVPVPVSWDARANAFRMASTPRVHSHDVIGSLARLWAPALPAAAAALLPLAPGPPGCSGVGQQYLAHGRPPLSSVALADGTMRRRYPPLRAYTAPVGLRAVPNPGRWTLGPADSTGASPRPARQRETVLADGRRLVEKRHSTHTYYASGALESVSRDRLLGGAFTRNYYPDGVRKEEVAASWLGSVHRTWDASGHLTHRDYESPVDLRQVRASLKRLHPGRAFKRALRRFHPLQPLYRVFRRVFPRHDHHTPRRPRG